MVKNEEKDNAEINLVSCILRLINKKVPILAFWQHKGELKKIGTSNMDQWFEELDDETKNQLRTSMGKDLFSLGDGTEDHALNPESIPLKVRASRIYRSMTTSTMHHSGIPELPFPLSLMSQKEKSEYIRDLIRAEAKRDKARVIYGYEEWRPSFWLEERWNWANIKQPISKTNEGMFTGAGTWSDFLSDTIKNILEKKSLKPEEHVNDLRDKTTVLKKKIS